MKKKRQKSLKVLPTKFKSVAEMVYEKGSKKVLRLFLGRIILDYSVLIYPDVSKDSGFVAEMPLLNFLIVKGKTQEEALTKARKAGMIWLEKELEQGRSLPKDFREIAEFNKGHPIF